MAKNVQGTSEFYSIVIVGAMNPRIHHPWWYKHIGILDDESEKSALESKELIVTPPVAQFPANNWTMVCQQERWEIRALSADTLDLILDAAMRVFRALEHTPINAFGFNFNFHRETRLSDVGQCLAERIVHLNIGLVPEGTPSATLSLRNSSSSGTWNTNLSGSAHGPNAVYVGNNIHYKISDIQPEDTSFDLGAMLKERFRPDCEQATRVTDCVVEALNRLCVPGA